MIIIENVIYREVVVVEVASSELGNSWTLAEKVKESFLLMSTKEAFFCVRFVHAVEVFIQTSRPQCPVISWIAVL